MLASAGPRAFVDSNIWLYAFTEPGVPPKSEVANRLIRNITPVVSPQVINEVCSNLIKKVHWPENEVSELIESFFVDYEVIGFSKELLLHASDLRIRVSLSFWDSLIVAGALKARVKTLYSEDLQHGQVIEGSLTVTNPFVVT